MSQAEITAPSDPTHDPLYDGWLRSPERMRNRGAFRVLGALGTAMMYGGVILTVVPRDPYLPEWLAIAVTAIGFLLLLLALYSREIARAKYYERQDRAANRGVDDALERLESETDLRGLLRLNRRQMEAYEALTRRQAASSYRLSHVALGVGFAVVVTGAIGGLTASDPTSKVIAASLGGVSAAISGYVARTYLRIYERTLVQLNHYFEQPLVSSYVLTSERLIDKMSSERRDEALGRLMDELLVWRSALPKGNGRVVEEERAQQATGTASG